MSNRELVESDYAFLDALEAPTESTLFEHAERATRLAYLKKAHFLRLIEKWRASRIPIGNFRKEIDRLLPNYRRKMNHKSRPGKDGFVRDHTGKIMARADNIQNAIQKLGVRVRYDAFRGQPCIDGLGGHGPSLDDAALRRLYIRLFEDFEFAPSRALYDDVVLDLAHQNLFHPVRDYLSALDTYGVWDGAARIDTWLIDYAGADDTPFNRAAGRLVLLAAVRRVRQPGSKFDELLVLESPDQGLGKSSLVEALAVKPDWYSDSVQLSAGDKEMIESTSGHWVVEVGELQGMRKGEVERMRAQLSRKTDRARMAYARLPTEVPRQYILIGTTNASPDSPYLADIHGNRRFWPVTVGRCDVAGVIRDRDQLWAEASLVEASHKGDIRLPEQLWPAAGEQQSMRATGNQLHDVLAPLLDGHQGILLADDVWELLRIPTTQREHHTGKMGAAMKKLGWERKQRRRRGTDPLACYVKGESGHWLLVERNEFGRGGLQISTVASTLESTTEG